MSKYNGLVVSKYNPFIDDILRMTVKREKITTSSGTIDMNRDKVTVLLESKYVSQPFVKLYHSDVLDNITNAYTCKVLFYIMRNMKYEQEKIKLTANAVGMDKEALKRVILELMLLRVIVPEKRRGWYWVNLTIIISGTLNIDKIKTIHPKSSQHDT